MLFSRTQHQKITQQGGLVIDTGEVDVAPGQMIGCSNIELTDRVGWKSIDGYERFDGRPSPSDADYFAITVLMSDPIPIYTLVYWGTPVSNGIIINEVDVNEEHSLMILHVFSGDSPSLTDEIYDVATSTLIADVSGINPDITIEEDLLYTENAATAARNLINPLPLDGKVLGVWSFGGKVYAFQNDLEVSPTKAVMYESSDTGWVEVIMPYSFKFTDGTVPATEAVIYPQTGDTVTSSGGATGVIVKIQKTSGSYSDDIDIDDGDATGVITIATHTGTFTLADTITITTSNVTAIISETETQTVILPDGDYEFDNYNFFGGINDLNMYGVDKVNPAFEFDGTNYSQIHNDIIPEHMFIMEFQMFVSSVGFWLSSPHGNPFDPWTTVQGADEWSQGDQIVAGVPMSGGTAISYARNSISIIYPTGSVDPPYFSMKTYTTNYGAIENSPQTPSTPYFVSDAGISVINRTDKFGDFNTDVVDHDIKSLINARKDQITASVLFRTKNEYRIYFDNGSCIRLKFRRGVQEGFTIDDYPLVVRGITSSIRSDRFLSNTSIEKDHVFFFSDDKYVYQMDAGTSFDGEEIYSFLELPYNHMASERVKKRWYDAMIEIETEGAGTLHVKPIYTMFRKTLPQILEKAVDYFLGGANWSGANWSEFFWGSDTNDTFRKIRLRGVSPGLGLQMYSKGKNSFTIKSILMRYAGRGEVR